MPDTTYYTEDNEKGKELLEIWREMQEELLGKYGFTAEEIKDLLDKVIDLDAKLAKYVLSHEESSEYVELYHPYDWADFTKLAPELPLDSIFTEILDKSLTRLSSLKRASGQNSRRNITQKQIGSY